MKLMIIILPLFLGHIIAVTTPTVLKKADVANSPSITYNNGKICVTRGIG